MENLPLISVIVPVYKVEKYLDRCIQSMTEQTYSNLEIILVVDGSPDTSSAICDAWAAKDSRIRVIHKENGGAGLARNDALDIAKGELIGFVDSDDYIAPDMYETLYGLLRQGADISECGYVTTEDDHVAFDEVGDVTIYTAEQAMACNIQDTVFRQLIWNKLYRREMVGDIRFPVGRKIDDEFFTYKVLGNAKKLALTTKRCYAYRQQPYSVMHQKNPVKAMEGIQAKQERLAYIQKNYPDLENQAKLELLMACVYAMQTCRKERTGQEKISAMKELRSVIDKLEQPDLSEVDSGKRKLLLKMAMKYPEMISGLLNFLIDIHILT